jgi:hypothetical protein
MTQLEIRGGTWNLCHSCGGVSTGHLKSEIVGSRVAFTVALDPNEAVAKARTPDCLSDGTLAACSNWMTIQLNLQSKNIDEFDRATRSIGEGIYTTTQA